MTKTQVRVSAVGFGDTIQFKGRPYLVTSVDGPDANGTYDLYLMGRDGVPVHEVVCEAVELFCE